MFKAIIDTENHNIDDLLPHKVWEYETIAVGSDDKLLIIENIDSDNFLVREDDHKYIMTIDKNETIEGLIETLMINTTDEEFFIRTFNNSEVWYMDTNRPYGYELETFTKRECGSLHSLCLKQEEGENLKKYKDLLKISNTLVNNIQDVITLIAAQGHNAESVEMLMKFVDTALRRIPFTPIAEGPEEDEFNWYESYEEEFEYLEKLIKNNPKYKSEYYISTIHVNARHSNLISVEMYRDDVYITEGVDKIEYPKIVYYKLVDELIKKDNVLYFDLTKSFKEVTLPWSYESFRIREYNPEIDDKSIKNGTLVKFAEE